MIKKIIPDAYVSSIYDIPYTKLYEEGKRLILTDLDNTLISYMKTDPTPELFKWKEDLLALGFEIIIVSNSKKDRVSHFASMLGLKYVKFSRKPLKIGFRKALKLTSRKYELNEIVELGDQLMTDVFGSRRMGFYTYFVEAIDRKTEKLVTRFNRRIEKFFLKKVRRKYPAEYNERLKRYVEVNNIL